MPSYFRLFCGTLAASLLLFIAVAPARAQQPVVPAIPVAAAALPDAPATPSADNNSDPDATSPARIGGTVTDTNGDVIPGATVTLDGPNGSDHRTTTADDNASFEFHDLKPGVPYRVTISAKGFVDWKSNEIRLRGGDFQFVTGIRLPILGETTSVVVSAGTPVEIATEQVHIAEQQRVFGIIPNFYVVYDSENAVPLTTKLKFQLAIKTSFDPVTFAGAIFLGAINQAADTPNYPQGWKGYGERSGALFADGFTDTMIGGAILPTLLHQDPRYYYRGTGSTKSRLMHALSGPFWCKGDNGNWQPNYSSVGGDLISSAISNVYYPPSNRGVGFTFQNLAIDTAEREVSTIVQEFVLRKLTPSQKRQN
jgi:hypothetical protein